MSGIPHVVDDRYEVLEERGSGGMSRIYRAYDRRTRRDVALKVLHAVRSDDPRAVARFRREMLATAAISHPNTIAVLDFGSCPTLGLFLVMELIHGVTIADLLDRGGRLDVARLVAIGAQIADALDAAHAQGVIHRDLKPSNVMVRDLERSRDFVTVMDFGVARITGLAAEGESTLTGSGVVGTPRYASPEQADGRPVDHRTDLYSLGVLLYEAATGRRPFEACTPMGLLYHHVHTLPPPPRAHRPDLPGWLEAVIVVLLAKDPADRPPDAAAVSAMLRREAPAPPVALPAPPAGVERRTGDDTLTPDPPHSWVAPRPRWAARLLTLAAVAALLALVATRLGPSPEPAAPRAEEVVLAPPARPAPAVVVPTRDLRRAAENEGRVDRARAVHTLDVPAPARPPARLAVRRSRRPAPRATASPPLAIELLTPQRRDHEPRSR